MCLLETAAKIDIDYARNGNCTLVPYTIIRLTIPTNNFLPNYYTPFTPALFFFS